MFEDEHSFSARCREILRNEAGSCIPSALVIRLCIYILVHSATRPIE